MKEIIIKIGEVIGSIFGVIVCFFVALGRGFSIAINKEDKKNVRKK
jgi:hypothetical protein